MTKTKKNTVAAMAKQLTVQVAQTDVLAELRATFGATVTRAQTKAWEKTQGVSLRFFRANKANRLGRGVYQIPASVTGVAGVAVAVPVVDDAATVVANATNAANAANATNAANAAA